METSHPFLTNGKSSPGNLQSTQHVSNVVRQMPQLSSLPSTQRHSPTIFTRLILTLSRVSVGNSNGAFSSKLSKGSNISGFECCFWKKFDEITKSEPIVYIFIVCHWEGRLLWASRCLNFNPLKWKYSIFYPNISTNRLNFAWNW